MEPEEKAIEQEKDKSAARNRDAHHGHAIKHLRIDKGLSQKELASLVHMSQQTLSRFEEKRVIEDEILNRFAKGLDVSVDLIKELEDERPLAYYIENNTFSGGSSAAINMNNNDTMNTNHRDETVQTLIEQLQKTSEENKQLYEKLLQSAQEKINALEQQLSQKKA